LLPHVFHSTQQKNPPTQLHHSTRFEITASTNTPLPLSPTLTYVSCRHLT
jgi:hypothetical protein